MGDIRVERVGLGCDNPAKFTEAYRFQVRLSCPRKLKSELDWKVTYCSSASLDVDEQGDSSSEPSTSDDYEVTLSELAIPTQEGRIGFYLDADAPDAAQIPKSHIPGTASIRVSGAYKGQQFVRANFIMETKYTAQDLEDKKPAEPVIDMIQRDIAEPPMLSIFNIEWDFETSSQYYKEDTTSSSD